MRLAAVVLVGLVVSAVGLVGEAVAPSWWGNAVYYRILVDSFKDGDGDGLGDLRGAQSKLSYVRAVGADAVILSPLGARSQDCSAPGPIEFSDLDPRYGDLQAFADFLEKAAKLELKVVVTLPLKTVSKASEWFTSSVERAPGFDDRILWREEKPDSSGILHVPPPSEINIQWVWSEGRGAFWASSNEEAVLDLCSESVGAALSAAQCAWLRRGAGGVLLDPDFRPDPQCGEKLLKRLVADAMGCVRAANLDTPAILVETSLDPMEAARYYSEGGVGANSVLSAALASSDRQNAAELGTAIYAALLTAPEGVAPSWVTSSTNSSRITSRYGNEMVDAINLLALILPGAAIIQQGDELGTADSILEWATSDKCWPLAANSAAAPFSWDDTVNAGFSSGEPWLPIAPNYRYANAKTQYANDLSHLGVVRLIAAMRKSPAIGPHVEIKRLKGALGVLRWGGDGSLLLVANLGRDVTEALLKGIPGLPSEMTVAISSAGSSFSIGAHLPVDKAIRLTPGEAVLLAGPPRHCGGPGPVDKITTKLAEGWQKINKYFSN